MHSISVRVPFDAAHRLLGHTGKCKFLHGHSYVATVVVSAERLGSLGMVADFAVLKNTVKTFIDQNWDHNTILNHYDSLSLFMDSNPEANQGRPIYTMMCNPTAENMAKELYDYLVKLGIGVKVESVTIRETENCSATYTG